MTKVFYADHHRMTFALSHQLKAQGLEVETLGGKDALLDFFGEEHYKRMGEYNVLIAHLGTTFITCVRDLLGDFPSLRIALVSEHVSSYWELGEHNRLLTCDYESPRLIPFITGREIN